MKETKIDIVDGEVSRLAKSMQSDPFWGKTNEANNFTIFRKPHHISQSKKKLFEPSVITIGPFHRDQKGQKGLQLQAFEEEKWRLLQGFLSRSSISLDLCLKEMKSLEEETRTCYSEKSTLDSDTFVKMMLLDGCFVLEYFLQLFIGKLNYSRVIYPDLLLLENQIPFFIVEKLYQIGLKQEDRMNFEKYRMSFVKYLAYMFLTLGLTKDINSIPYPPSFKKVPDPPAEIQDSIHSKIPEPPAEIPNPPDKIHHLVHLCYHYLVPHPEPRVPLNSEKGDISSMVIPSATELKNKGLKLKPKSNPKHMLDISFDHGVLQIPKLAITAENKPILANLVAFEQSKHANKDLPFTRFVIFLDNLINTVSDVKILQKCGIVENWLDSEKEVTQFINQFTEVDFFERDHYLAGLYMKVNGYIKSNWDQSRWKKQRAKLKREYFSSPWKAISVVAAFILLVLTCVQTFYAVYA
ncbi:UPF0481 protein At3g47200-like [Carex rostrata]